MFLTALDVRCATKLAVAAAVLVVGGVSTPSRAEPPAVAIDSYGATYGEWSARWWQWWFSLPAEKHPAVGGDCDQGEYDHVWFLAPGLDPAGGPVERWCTVPAATPLFFGLAAGLSGTAYFPTGSMTLTDFRRNAAEFVGTIDEGSLFCVVDDIDCAEDLAEFRVTSPAFAVIPAKEVLLPPAGSAPGGRIISQAENVFVTDGYWILLPPLAPGEHTLEFGADSLDVTYHIDVVE